MAQALLYWLLAYDVEEANLHSLALLVLKLAPAMAAQETRQRAVSLESLIKCHLQTKQTYLYHL